MNKIGTRKSRKYTWPTDLEFLEYKKQGLSGIELARLLSIPEQVMRKRLNDLGITLRPHRDIVKKTAAIPMKKIERKFNNSLIAIGEQPKAIKKPEDRAETVEEFLARGKKIHVLKANDWSTESRKACTAIGD